MQDIPRIRQFYEGLLGLEVIHEEPGHHIFFRAGTSVLLCFVPEKSKVKTSLPPHWAKGPQHIAFEVEAAEYEPWKEKLQKAGIPITHEQEWKDDRKSCYFEDPEGHVLEIVPPHIWE